MMRGMLYIISIISVLMVAAPGVVAQPSGGNASCAKGNILTAPAWHRGLTGGPDCSISLDNVNSNPDFGGKIGPFIFILGLNIVEIMMHLVAYVSVAYIIVGGFKFMTSAGSADGSVKARKTIINAIIGLVISLVAIGAISFIVGGLT